MGTGLDPSPMRRVWSVVSVFIMPLVNHVSAHLSTRFPEDFGYSGVREPRLVCDVSQAPTRCPLFSDQPVAEAGPLLYLGLALSQTGIR